MLVIFLFMLLQIGFSQSHTHEKAASANEGTWKPINKFTNPSSNTTSEITPMVNLLNGVFFYSKNSVCEAEKVIILKLINSNNYAVTIAYQLDPILPKVIIEIPANSNYEGSCVPTKNENESKLIIRNTQELDKEKIQEYIFSQITVTKM
ncbi:MAG: hypothetical protein CVT98_00040 [Bacteroidetes bacterium HGW-Bacteroidetes-15]|nr:MAG: hypothetical protein CVT98_00040 [Bacteroidetes bacterium HGW-Bacteroidetes-15]